MTETQFQQFERSDGFLNISRNGSTQHNVSVLDDTSKQEVAKYIYNGNVDTLVAGTHGNDTITGWSQAESINGGDGHDLVHSSNGDDTVIGGNGNDTHFYLGAQFPFMVGRAMTP